MVLAAAFFLIIGGESALRAAEIVKFTGLVEYKAADALEWVRVTEDTIPHIGKGDQLRTGRASSAEIKLDDESLVKMSPLSSFSLGLETRDSSSIDLGIGRRAPEGGRGRENGEEEREKPHKF